MKSATDQSNQWVIGLVTIPWSHFHLPSRSSVHTWRATEGQLHCKTMRIRELLGMDGIRFSFHWIFRQRAVTQFKLWRARFCYFLCMNLWMRLREHWAHWMLIICSIYYRYAPKVRANNALPVINKLNQFHSVGCLVLYRSVRPSVLLFSRTHVSMRWWLLAFQRETKI